MNSKPSLNTLMIRYLSDTATEDDKIILSRYLSEDSEESREARRIIEVHLKLHVLLGAKKGAESMAEVVTNQHDAEKEKIVSMPPHSRVSGFKWWKPLAAAAILLGALGIWTLFGPSEGTDEIRIVSIHGKPEREGSKWQTDSDSSIYLQYADESDVLIGPDTRVQVALNEVGGKNINQLSGNLYVNLTRQEKPCNISAGSTALELKGTRFLSRINDRDHSEVWLVEGSLGVSASFASVTLRPGQKAICTGWSKETRQPLIRVRSFDASDTSDLPLDWMNDLGEKPGNLMTSRTSSFDSFATDKVDFDNYAVGLGHWTILRDSEEIILRKENTGRALIMFGKPEWKKGRISFEFRFSGKPSSSTKLLTGVYYSNPEALANAVNKRTTRDFGRDANKELWDPDKPWADDVFDMVGFSPNDLEEHEKLSQKWHHLEMTFSVKGNNKTELTDFEMWPVNNPAERKVFFKPGHGILRTPEGSAVKRRHRAGVAIHIDGRKIEIRNLTVRGKK